MVKPIKKARRQKGIDMAITRKERKAKGIKGRTFKVEQSALSAPTRGQVAAIQKLFDRIQPDELTAALESSDAPNAQRLLEVMSDPVYAKQAMAMQLRAAGMSVNETLKAITSMYHSDAALRVARRIPAIMEQMAVECEPHEVVCPKCLGLPDDDTVCPKCGGRQVVIVAADNDVRKMILENQDLLGTKAPLIDARQVHVYGAPDMTDWSRQSDDSMERRVARRQIVESTEGDDV